ncbi:MAG TPA: Gfo/Idh/MocA family oxidoreductase [Humisphaera sp.]
MPTTDRRRPSRRAVLKSAAAAAAAIPFHIVPRHCLGGPDAPAPPPSETVTGALIGVGGRGPGTFSGMVDQFKKLNMGVKKVAECDVKYVGRADDKTLYTDFRRLLDRDDLDVVAIATPPHWHGLISIAAAQAGKDVLCEKPMTRTIAEGRAVVNAFKRYNRVYQVGTFGRFSVSRDKGKIETHKLMRSGLLTPNPGVHVKAGGLKVKEWSGRPNVRIENPPKNLDWDLYCGPRPLKPFVGPRFGQTHRQYWDYDGGGLSDMGQHFTDPFQWTYGKDDTSPVRVEAHAPPQHPEVTGMWAWVELTYADGFTLVLDSREWGEPYDRKPAREPKVGDLSEADQKKFKAIKDPAPLLTFAEAVVQRKEAGGNAEVSHRACTILNLATIAIRLGRPLTYDPVAERFENDEEANRLVDQPMRAPWHL